MSASGVTFKQIKSNNSSTIFELHINLKNIVKYSTNFYIHFKYFKKNIQTYAIFLIVWISLWILPFVTCGCRYEIRNKCEAICTGDNALKYEKCVLRAVILLPLNSSYEVSQMKVKPIFYLAEKRIRDLKLLQPNIKIEWITYDDMCDPSFAVINAMDGYRKNCAHVLFGPTCDYALASVGRIVKYFRAEGTPLISVGGFTFDFQLKKRDCSDEFYMLVRTGMLSFQTIAEMMTKIMKSYSWTHAVFLYERNGQYSVSGLHTCHLMMSTMAQNFRKSNLVYSSFVADVTNENSTRKLLQNVGLEHSRITLNLIFVKFLFGGFLCVLFTLFILSCKYIFKQFKGNGLWFSR